jgi:4-amino-4-deoxy-L-arabinose transferase-like glycosyltransferase
MKRAQTIPSGTSNPIGARSFPSPFAWAAGAAFIAALLLRWSGAFRDYQYTFDESLYQELGYQLYLDPGNYSPQPVYRKLLDLGRQPPAYLNQPLFKHPPLFSYLIALFLHIFGATVTSALLIPVLLGSLSIWIIYLLGSKIFGPAIGMISAVLLCLDPVHWICSQKLWPGSTQALFVLLALYFFVRGWERERFYLFSGISLGLALLVKYSSILLLPTLLGYALIFKRNLLRKIWFWLLWAAALLTFLPWALWYLAVYGGFGDLEILGIPSPVIGHILNNLRNSLIWVIPGMALLAVIGRLLFQRQQDGRNNSSQPLPTAVIAPPASRRFRILILAGIPLLIAGVIIFFPHLLSPAHIPITGWERHFFGAEPIWFYFRRLPELSPFYLFAFLGLFKIASKNDGARLIALFSLLVLLFHSWWANFQSRYIITAVPPLLLLAAAVIRDGWSGMDRKNIGPLSLWARILYAAILLYFTGKVIVVGLKLGLPNTVCYF